MISTSANLTKPNTLEAEAEAGAEITTSFEAMGLKENLLRGYFTER